MEDGGSSGGGDSEGAGDGEGDAQRQEGNTRGDGTAANFGTFKMRTVHDCPLSEVRRLLIDRPEAKIATTV